MSYVIYYHSECKGFTGRAYSQILMLEHAGKEYTCVAPDQLPADAFPCFAPPFIKLASGTVMAQTAAIEMALGKELGLVPSTVEGENHAAQIVLNVADILTERTKNKVICQHEEYLEGRGGKWYGQFEKMLELSGSGFIVGDKLSYADFSVYTVVAGFNTATFGSQAAMSAFPKLVAHKAMIDALPKVAAFNAKGIAFLPPFANPPRYPIKAICSVSPEGKPCGGAAESTTPCTGTIWFEQTDADTCKIRYEIKGLSPGLHGFHVHEKADFSNGCTSAGPHWNPHKKTHGAPADEERHAGDLGNIEPGADGVARGEIVDRLIKLEGEFKVVGRSMMVHADPDDLGRGDNSEPGPPPVNGKASKATGNAGARIACGEIKRDN